MSGLNPIQNATSLLLSILIAFSSHAQSFDRAVVLPPAEVELLDPASAAHLENAKRFITEHQWSEAVEAIRRVQEASPLKLVQVELASPLAGFERYVPASEYCQWRLAALSSDAPEALEHYRRLVDPLAGGWLRESETKSDKAPLLRIADQAFASRYGDDALFKLGDLALARGDYASARAVWRRIWPGFSVSIVSKNALSAPVGSPLWLPLRHFDFTAHGGELAPFLKSTGPPPLATYPDTDLDLAAVQARLVLASIFEGSRERAAVELAILQLLFPEAQGRLAGREGLYFDLLQGLLDESKSWPGPRQSPDWTTFGGNACRSLSATVDIDPAGHALWSFPLPRLNAEREVLGGERLRPGDDRKALLAYHPIVVGGKVFLRFDAQGKSHIVALALKSGKQLWQVDYSRGLTSSAPANTADGKPYETSDAHPAPVQHAGVARYTLTSIGDKVFARMGSPITIPSSRRAASWLARDQGFLLGLDIVTEGKPLEGFPIRPPSNEWTFEGAPLASDGMLYVAMRRAEGARSQIYLAAFELQTTAVQQADNQDETFRPIGRLKWRTLVCSSATPGGGDLDELTHLLITENSGRLFLNTNAGVVAAVDSVNGRLLWLLKYPRATLHTVNSYRLQRQLNRDLVPCLARKDIVIVAPADCDRIFALDSTTGQLAWALPPSVADDAVHLLGIAGDMLLASGDYLYWIDVHTGEMLTQFPIGALGGAEQAAPSPRGLGRGLIVGQSIWWPTRESIYVFATRPELADFGWQPKVIREIPLLPRGVTGGNLVIADGILLIASGDKLVAFGE